MSLAQALRAALAILAGMIFITVGVEALEWTLVTAINRAPTTDPEVYYGIRNGTVFLLVKVLYNTAAAIGGGYIAARLAGRNEMAIGLALAIIVVTIIFIHLVKRHTTLTFVPLLLLPLLFL